jgi:hypothetical protein
MQQGLHTSLEIEVLEQPYAIGVGEACVDDLEVAWEVSERQALEPLLALGDARRRRSNVVNHELEERRRAVEIERELVGAVRSETLSDARASDVERPASRDRGA